VDPIAALALPAGARVDQRVPKKLLVENGAPTVGDKRRIQEGIEEVRWLAALKPTTIGVPEYRDPMREYLEIAVLTLMLRPSASLERLTELVHRAVPYPVLLFTWHGASPVLSLAHKRWSQGEEGKTVLDGEVIAARLWEERVDELTNTFCDALAISRQPRTTLYALYQGWIDAAQALRAARVTGVFSVPTSAAEAAAREEALREYSRLEAQVAGLRTAAGKEKQLPRQVEMNLELKRLQAARDAARARL